MALALAIAAIALFATAAVTDVAEPADSEPNLDRRSQCSACVRIAAGAGGGGECADGGARPGCGGGGIRPRRACVPVRTARAAATSSCWRPATLWLGAAALGALSADHGDGGRSAGGCVRRLAISRFRRGPAPAPQPALRGRDRRRRHPDDAGAALGVTAAAFRRRRVDERGPRSSPCRGSGPRPRVAGRSRCAARSGPASPSHSSTLSLAPPVGEVEHHAVDRAVPFAEDDIAAAQHAMAWSNFGGRSHDAHLRQEVLCVNLAHDGRASTFALPSEVNACRRNGQAGYWIGETIGARVATRSITSVSGMSGNRHREGKLDRYFHEARSRDLA